MTDDVETQDNNKIWKMFRKLLDHSDNIYYQRFNFFLVAESMLIVSFATLLNKNYDEIKIAITLLGMIFTVGLLYVNARLGMRMRFVIEKYLKRNPLYKEYIESVGGIYSNAIQAYILPIATLLFWIFLFLYTTLENIDYQLVAWWFISFFIIISFSLWMKCCLPNYSEKDFKQN